MPHAPKQQRSLQTERRLLDAAEALIQERGLSGISIAEVVRRGSSSVGNFYSRFGDKDGLLRALHARRLNEVLEVLDGLASTVGAMERETAVHLCMSQIVQHYEDHAALMAAFNARSAADPIGWSQSIALHVELVQRLAELLSATDGTSAHPRPRAALELGLHMAFSFLGDRSIHGTLGPSHTPFPPAQLPGELTRLILGYWRGLT